MEPGYQCLRCSKTFESECFLELHLQAMDVCTPKKRSETRMFGMEKKEQLKKRCSNGKSDTEKWAEIYGVLFPDDTRIPSAYQDEAALSEYREYAREMLPRMLADELNSMETSTSGLAPLAEPTVEILVRVMCACHENMLHQFQRNPPLQALSEISTDSSVLTSRSANNLPTAASHDFRGHNLADLGQGHSESSWDIRSLNPDIFSEFEFAGRNLSATGHGSDERIMNPVDTGGLPYEEEVGAISYQSSLESWPSH